MNKIAGAMKSLCDDIITGREDRKSAIKNLKGKAEAIRENARKVLADSKKFHEKMSKGLKKGLRESREDLIKNVSILREDFRKKGKEVRADLAGASKIWNRMNETLRDKRIKPNRNQR